MAIKLPRKDGPTPHEKPRILLEECHHARVYISNGHTAITKEIQKYLISEKNVKKCGPKNGSDLESPKNVKKCDRNVAPKMDLI